MKTLHLSLKKEWFDMILCRKKPYEYRNLKTYWFKRLIKNTKSMKQPEINQKLSSMRSFEKTGDLARFLPGYNFRHFSSEDLMKYLHLEFEHFDIVRCVNGYGNDKPMFDIEFKQTNISPGYTFLGALPGVYYFEISLGKILNTRNIK